MIFTRGDTNPKTRKLAEALGVRSVVLHFAPADISGRNVCPWSTAGCRAACLNTAGRGATLRKLSRRALLRHSIHRARIRRTDAFFDDRPKFLRALAREIRNLQRTAEKRSLYPAVRLNGTSDIPWESIKLDGRSLMEHFPAVQFYDYTKSKQRARDAALSPSWPRNYHLTYSRTESDKVEEIAELLSDGVSVAVVFADALPEHWAGAPVIDGTAHDFRFLDPAGAVVGLVALGRGKVDASGFVVRLETAADSATDGGTEK